MLIVAWLEVQERDQPYPQSWSPWLREKLLSVHCFGRMSLTDVGLARFQTVILSLGNEMREEAAKAKRNKGETEQITEGTAR